MKKWNTFLQEQKSEIITEFNRKDEESIMAVEDRFSVAFEIELETEGDPSNSGDWEYDMEDAMDRARRESALNYIHDTDEWFRQGARDYDVEYYIENLPEDGTEFFEWYYDNIKPMTYANLDMIRLAIALDTEYSDDYSEAREEIDKVWMGVMEDPMKLLRAINQNGARRNELQDLLGWSDQQMTLPFEKEGGKAFHPGYESIVKDPKIMMKILEYFVGDIGSLPNEKEIFSKAKHPKAIIDIESLFLLYGADWDKIMDISNNVVEEHITDSLGGTFEDTFNNLPTFTRAGTWTERVSDKMFAYVESALDELVDSQILEFENDPVEYLDQMGIEDYFDEWSFRDDYEMEYGRGGDCDVDSLESLMYDYFPRFMRKYDSTLDFTEDGSLTCGIEFKQDNPPYMTGLEEAIEYLTDFFDEYDDQEYFQMTEATGLHTNIGWLGEDGEPVDNYNLFKGLMFINHTYATKGVGFPSREYSQWSGDLKEPAIRNIKAFIMKLQDESEHERVLTKKSFMKKYLSRNFDELGEILSNRVLDAARQQGSKRIGFNVNYTPSRNYIEYRYPGEDDPNLENMTKALKYYAFVTRAAGEPDYKKKEYIKDLIGFINNLEGEKLRVSDLKFLKGQDKLKKGDLLLKSGYSNSLFRAIEKAYEQSLESTRDNKAMGELDIGRASYSYSNDGIWTYARAKDIPASFFSRIMRDQYPVYYRGLQGGKVVLDTIKTSEVSEGRRVVVKREYVDPKIFQEEMSSGLYEKTKHFGEKALGAYTDLIRLMVKNKDSYLDLAKAFHKVVEDVTPDNETNSLELYNMVWKEKESENTKSTKKMRKGSEEAENEAEAEKLTDWLINDILGESVLYGKFEINKTT